MIFIHPLRSKQIRLLNSIIVYLFSRERLEKNLLFRGLCRLPYLKADHFASLDPLQYYYFGTSRFFKYMGGLADSKREAAGDKMFWSN